MSGQKFSLLDSFETSCIYHGHPSVCRTAGNLSENFLKHINDFFIANV